MCECLILCSVAMHTFYLSSQVRLARDILPGANNRLLLLETLLAAREKIYLLYTNRDTQKDQLLHPAAPVLQLRQYLKDHVVAGDFEDAVLPLTGTDPKYLAPRNDAKTDVWV